MKKLKFTVSALPHPQSKHFSSRIFNLAHLLVYKDNEIVVQMRTGSKRTQEETLKEIVGSYLWSRNVQLIKVEEV